MTAPPISTVAPTSVTAEKPIGSINTSPIDAKGSAPPKIAIRACVACRQMKMKCEGAEDPPCKRCQKVGRECVPQSNRHRGSHELQSPMKRGDAGHSSVVSLHPERPSNTIVSVLSPVNESVAAISYRAPHRRPPPVMTSYGGSHVTNLSELPSIYSTPPVDTVSEESRYQNSPRLAPSVIRKRKRHTDTLSSEDATMSPASYIQRDLVLTKNEMKDMIQLFCQRHLQYIPALYYEDYDDAESLIQNELPFVYCICYVTARYLPGGREIREMLLPEISRFPREIFAPRSEGKPSDWVVLKGLIVLYSYADITPLSQLPKSSADQEINFWPLKYAVEVLALRLSLHRSIQDLRPELESSSVLNLGTLNSYKRYNVWLWLFNMAHYCSIVSGTPPSIRIDYSIRASSSVVDKIGQGPELNNLFGIVELYMIWEEASANHPQLGEWWCLPDPTDVVRIILSRCIYRYQELEPWDHVSRARLRRGCSWDMSQQLQLPLYSTRRLANLAQVDENSVEAMIKETDRAIGTWRIRWDEYIKSGDDGAFLEYHARYTKFCIASYAIKCVRSSPQLTALQADQIERCAACANHVIDWPLNRGPIQKDRLRFIDDSACIMISFCSLFILSICQAFPSCVPNISNYLDNVTEAAQLMIDLAINSEQKPHVQGVSILKRTEALKVALENARNSEGRQNLDAPTDSREPFTPDSSALVFEGLESWFNDENFFGMEPMWHFPNVLPSSN